MSSHTFKPIQLKYSQPTRQRGTARSYRSLNRGRQFKGQSIPKPIHAYRMWFLFLKLSLELEEQGVELIMKRPLKGAIISRKIRVNRKKYQGWNLDDVLKLKFNDWWKTHDHLFNDEVTKVLDDSDTITDDPNYLSIRIDMRMRINDIVSSVTDEVKKNKRERKKLLTKKIPKFSINGNVHKTTLINRYNCLLLKLENKLSNKEIITHPNDYIRDNPDPPYDIYGNKDYSRLVWGYVAGSGLTFGAKQILLSVCDGYFLKHPTKNYLS